METRFRYGDCGGCGRAEGKEGKEGSVSRLYREDVILQFELMAAIIVKNGREGWDRPGSRTSAAMQGSKDAGSLLPAGPSLLSRIAHLEDCTPSSTSLRGCDARRSVRAGRSGWHGRRSHAAPLRATCDASHATERYVYIGLTAPCESVSHCRAPVPVSASHRPLMKWSSPSGRRLPCRIEQEASGSRRPFAAGASDRGGKGGELAQGGV